MAEREPHMDAGSPAAGSPVGNVPRVTSAAADATLAEWERRALLALLAYNLAASRCRTLSTVLGASSAVLAGAVGTAVFASLSRDPSTLVRVTVGLVSVLTAVLASIQTFANWSARIDDYERAARRFGAVRRMIERERSILSEARNREVLREVEVALNEAAEASPNAPGRIYARVRRHMKGQFTRTDRIGAWIRGVKLEQLGVVQQRWG